MGSAHKKILMHTALAALVCGILAFGGFKPLTLDALAMVVDAQVFIEEAPEDNDNGDKAAVGVMEIYFPPKSWVSPGFETVLFVDQAHNSLPNQTGPPRA